MRLLVKLTNEYKNAEFYRFHVIISIMNVIIRSAKGEDAKEIQNVFHKSWIATYPNKEFGITLEDIAEHFKNAYANLKSFNTRDGDVY